MKEVTDGEVETEVEEVGDTKFDAILCDVDEADDEVDDDETDAVDIDEFKELEEEEDVEEEEEEGLGVEEKEKFDEPG